MKAMSLLSVTGAGNLSSFFSLQYFARLGSSLSVQGSSSVGEDSLSVSAVSAFFGSIDSLSVMSRVYLGSSLSVAGDVRQEDSSRIC